MRYARCLFLLMFLFSCLRLQDRAKRDYAQTLAEEDATWTSFQYWDEAHQLLFIPKMDGEKVWDDFLVAMTALDGYRKRRKELMQRIFPRIQSKERERDVLARLENEEEAEGIVQKEKARARELKEAISAFKKSEEGRIPR